jgi:hypothetical protein
MADEEALNQLRSRNTLALHIFKARILAMDSVSDSPFDASWNFIATALGYEDVDEMLAPYIQFDLTTASYAAITHTHVWAPHAQSTSLLHGESMCGNQESLTGKAKEADEAMHSQLRTVAAQFLTDVRNTATDKRLFGDTFLKGVSGAFIATASAWTAGHLKSPTKFSCPANRRAPGL